MKAHAPFPLLVAEIANTHGGSAAYLSALVEKLARSRVPGIKFQLIAADDFVPRTHDMYPVFKSFEFETALYCRLTARLRKAGKLVLADVFGDRSLRMARALGVDILKVYASDLDNFDLIGKVLARRKPVIISTGGASLADIDAAMRFCRSGTAMVLSGFQAFPTPLSEAHLNRIPFFIKRYGTPVGFMDHSAGDSPFSTILPCMAVAQGATLIEKHVFLSDRKTKYDWQSAISVDELDTLYDLLLQARDACGEKTFALSEAERQYFREKRKVAIAARAVPAGAPLAAEDIQFMIAQLKPSDKPVTRAEFSRFVGKRLKAGLSRGTLLQKDMMR